MWRLYFTRGAERCFRATRSEQIAANGVADGVSSATRVSTAPAAEVVDREVARSFLRAYSPILRID
jgi:hypothetical protein